MLHIIVILQSGWDDLVWVEYLIICEYKRFMWGLYFMLWLCDIIINVANHTKVNGMREDVQIFWVFLSTFLAMAFIA